MEKDQDVAELKLMLKDYRENLAASQAKLQHSEAKLAEYARALGEDKGRLNTYHENLTASQAKAAGDRIGPGGNEGPGRTLQAGASAWHDDEDSGISAKVARLSEAAVGNPSSLIVDSFITRASLPTAAF